MTVPLEDLQIVSTLPLLWLEYHHLCGWICFEGQKKGEKKHEMEHLDVQEAADKSAVLLVAAKAPDVCLQVSQVSHDLSACSSGQDTGHCKSGDQNLEIGVRISPQIL